MMAELKADQKRETERKVDREAATRLEDIYDKTDDNQMRVEPEKENLEKMEPNPGEKVAVVERQEIPNEEVAIHSLRECRSERTACQEMTEANLECEEPISADMKACQETTACHGATEIDTEKIEPNPEMMQSVEEHQEIPKEGAIVKPVEGRKKRHRGRKLAAGRRGEPKELIRGICGSRSKLAAACRKVSRRARMARHKGKILMKIQIQGNCGSRKKLAAGRKMTFHAGVTLRKGKFVRKYSTRNNVEKKPGKDERRKIYSGKTQNAKRHCRVYLETAVTSGKKRTGLKAPQEHHRARSYYD
jgi:hypothetical protein